MVKSTTGTYIVSEMAQVYFFSCTKNNQKFCDICGYKRIEQQIFPPPLLLVFLDPGSEIRYPGWIKKSGPVILGPKWHSPIGSMPYHRARKTLHFQGPTPPTCPRNVSAHIKNITHGAV
jgi:hypothetical protein